VPNENFDAITNRVNAFWIHRVDEPGVDNKNLYLHDPALERFPYRDVALGVHLIRWLSLLMGGGVILCVFGATRELVPRRPALAVVATALVAFNPMFLFISTSVHDDALANLVAAAILYVTARLLSRGPTVQQAVVLGGLLGLALLTKLTCLLVAPTVGLALLSQLRTVDGRVRWRELLRLGGTVALLALLVGGWWLARNQLLYGEPTSMGRQVEAWGGLRSNAPNVTAAVRELGFLHDSFWGCLATARSRCPNGPMCSLDSSACCR
jgi:4-amino-4-deoxy-L-arabinose transferase-like glycosyltransferase